MNCPNCHAANTPTAQFCRQCGHRLPQTGPLPPGVLMHGRYAVIKLLGQGGMGAVYQVADRQMFDRPYALKELLDTFTDPTDRAEARQLFEQEARLLVQLDHPNLPRIVDYFTERGRQYLVMDLVEGHTLAERLAAHPAGLPEAEVRRWAGQLCQVLDYLHRRQPPVIFRDLKPANIMLTPTGDIKLIDFGIARLFDPTKQTDTLKMGSIGYAPPEQYGGRGQTDARTDIYALGVVLHQLLTGHDPTLQPFALPLLRRLNPRLSANIEQVITTATDLDPARRYQSVAVMQAALDDETDGKGRTIAIVAATVGLLLVSWVIFASGLGTTGVEPTATQTHTAIAQVPTNTPSVMATKTDTATYTPIPPTATLTPTWTPTRTPRPPRTPTSTSTPTRTPRPTRTPTSTSTPTRTPRPMRTPTFTPTRTRTPRSTRTPTFTPTRTPRPTSTSTSTFTNPPSSMIFVPAGSFEMGSNNWGEASPIQTVNVGGFYIDQYEVTNAQFADFLNDMGNQSEDGALWLDAKDKEGDNQIHRNGGVWRADSGYANYPVVEVSWYGARAYCQWAGGRLPTEAEWEKAARGTDGRIYPWGNNYNGTQANFCDKSCTEGDHANSSYNDYMARSAPVGSYSEGVSPYGVHDMAGNVWEWVQSEFRDYPYQANDGRNRGIGGVRSIRGGSWNYVLDGLNAAYRGKDEATRTSSSIGFRCAR